MSARIRVPIDPEIADLVPRYLASRAADVERLSAALAAQDWDVARRLAHSMRGMGAAYGFQRISDLGAAMEQAALAEDGAGLEAGRAALADYLAQVEPVYE